MNGTRLLTASSLLVCTTLGTVACEGVAQPGGDRQRLAASNTEFAAALYQKLKDAEGNLFFSPYSISTALAMTYAGARGNTAKQMAATLHFTLDPKRLHPSFEALETRLRAIEKKGHVRLHVANSLWPHNAHSFLKSYLDLIKKYYGASITPVDYVKAAEAARLRINKWVEDKTNGKIKDLIPAGVLDEATRLVLVNAIYFKGNWAVQFDEKATSDDDFQAAADRTVKVRMMHQTETFGYAENDQLQILEMPYDGDDLSMIILLPKERDGLAELEKALTAETLLKWTRGLKKEKVEVALPKFSLTSQFRLDQTLAAMGMPDAFVGGKADFSGMDGRKWLFISAVIHKAFVDVNEEGTEAAAATGVSVTVGLAPAPRIPVFRADHPFVFMIRENRLGSILFLGRVVDPSAED